MAFGAAAASGTAGLVDVRAPETLRTLVPEVERLAANGLPRALRLTGLADPGPPILVLLAPEDSPVARSAPPWIAGWADGASSYVVLLPSRVDRYPDAGLGPLVRHELTHVLVARAAGGMPVPRWFDEGVAMAAGREWDLGDRARVALAVLSDGALPISRLDRAFAGGESEVQAAYALAGDLVRELERGSGEGAVGGILARLARGAPFAAAFADVTGTPLATFERTYWSHRSLWDRWVPIVSSSVIVWSGIALLTVAAFRRKRRRAAALRALWEIEDVEEDD